MINYSNHNALRGEAAQYSSYSSLHWVFKLLIKLWI